MSATPDEALRELGLTAATANALLFVPAAVVAWADGEADIKELEAIAARHRCDCEEGECLCLAESARQFLYYHFVYQAPKPDLVRRALACLAEQVRSQPADKADRLRQLILSVALDVARSSRQARFGRPHAVSVEERMALANVAGALGLHDVAALQRAIDAEP